MRNLLEGLAGPNYATPALWLFAGLAALILLWVVLRLLRRLGGGTFIAGGRTRRPRLAVVDAAAVDSRRRLVLVRRDEVEHLILIGGPSDLVVEEGIGAPARHPRPSSRTIEPAPAPVAVRTAVSQPGPPRPPAQTPQAVRPGNAEPEAAPSPPRSAPAAPAQRPAPQPESGSLEPRGARSAPHPQPAPLPRPSAAMQPSPVDAEPTRASSIVEEAPMRPMEPEDDLLRDLQVTLDRAERDGSSREEEMLEEEMNKLLGELSRDRR